MIISVCVHRVTLAGTVNMTLMTAKDPHAITMEPVLIKSMDSDVPVVKVLMEVTVRQTLMTVLRAPVVMEVGCCELAFILY